MRAKLLALCVVLGAAVGLNGLACSEENRAFEKPSGAEDATNFRGLAACLVDDDCLAPQTVIVELSNHVFTPADVTIKVGDTVRWVWVQGNHNVESGVDGVYDGIFRSGEPTTDPDTIFEVVFDEAFLAAHSMPDNLYPYYCIIHEGVGMTGTVTVLAGDCTASTCDTSTGDCVNVPNDAECNNGLFCDGTETCGANGCQQGSDPCPAQDCNESTDVCLPLSCTDGGGCDDGDLCNGAEACVGGICQAGTPLDCNDGNVCNGLETCDSSAGCQPGTPLVCDDGEFCTGVETCDPVDGCQAGTDPCTDPDFPACHEVADTCGQPPLLIELEVVAAGLTSPLVVTHAGDGSGRLFVVDQAGQIRIIQNGALVLQPFLDLTGVIVDVNPFFDERGVLGLAFHPNYAINGRFFVRYSAPRDGAPDEPCFGTSRGCHSEVLAEYGVSEGDPNLADPDSGVILFSVDEPQFNHDGGDVAFGPDGMLYFALGDGGGAHDGLADDPPSHGPFGHGQNIETALGAMLRIDVANYPPQPFVYAIPADNPFVGGPGLDEIYAYGLRNPYRFSFDDGPGGSGDLYLADVGQNRFEEVDIIVKGGNYGWVIKEGFHCFDPFNPLTPPDSCSDTGALGEPLLDPVAEYDHGDGIAVIGGFVYRGSLYPDLQSTYIFGDFSRTFFPGNGRLFYLDTEGDLSHISEFQLGATNDPLGQYLLGFGEDEDGEIYVLTSDNLAPSGTSGVVYRLKLPCLPKLAPCTDDRQCCSGRCRGQGHKRRCKGN